jgi:hypothetical protein
MDWDKMAEKKDIPALYAEVLANIQKIEALYARGEVSGDYRDWAIYQLLDTYAKTVSGTWERAKNA